MGSYPQNGVVNFATQYALKVLLLNDVERILVSQYKRRQHSLIYLDYEITASAKTYVTWSLNADGDPVQLLGRDDGEIVGYFIKRVGDAGEADFIEGRRIESATSVIDGYVESNTL